MIMVEQRITIEIDNEGRITAKTLGFKGDACMEELQKLLDGVISPSEFRPTDDYYQRTATTTKQNQAMERK